MNGQCQEIPELMPIIPEERKQHLLVLLGHLIHQRLIAMGSHRERTTTTGTEHRHTLRQDSTRILSGDAG
jgi:hypothetical protein